jgi:hypothetical protein
MLTRAVVAVGKPPVLPTEICMSAPGGTVISASLLQVVAASAMEQASAVPPPLSRK